MSTQTDIRTAVAEVSKRPLLSITSSSRLTEDLGIRSIQRVELAVLLGEKLGREVRDEQVMVSKTVGDLELKLGA
ncbi:MAG: acyl carrier protein [Myxococcota bacterium]